MGNRKAPHHRGAHQARAEQVRATAYANPSTTCPFCGLTLEQGRAAYGPGGEWEADHEVPGRIDSPLRPAHVHCNRSVGATLGNRRRTRKQSRNW